MPPEPVDPAAGSALEQLVGVDHDDDVAGRAVRQRGTDGGGVDPADHDRVGVLLDARRGNRHRVGVVGPHHLEATVPEPAGSEAVGAGEHDSVRRWHGGKTTRVPVARTEPRRALGAALAVVVGAVLLIALVLFLNSRGTSSGDGVFAGLHADDLIERQARDGVPTCVDDPVDGLRPICVFHTGDDPDAGWVAYDAQVDGCAFEPLFPQATELVDSCTGATYPFTGDGLPQYDVTVDDGRLAIDLDGADPTTTSSVVVSGDAP